VLLNAAVTFPVKVGGALKSKTVPFDIVCVPASNATVPVFG
jgi:hypothetical protein